jgi:hypothetical protein
MKQQVFVSYSHKDYDARDQLQRFLLPLERDGLIDAWVDTRLEGGDVWQEEIERALMESTVAVIFISQDFIASEFIFTKEMPYILAAALASKLTLIPVFLSPSSVESTDFSFTDPTSGQQTTVNLTRYQGYGTPEHPLSEMSWSDRERQYTQLAKRIRALLAGTQTKPAATPRMSAAISSAPPETTTYELSIHLARRGNNLVVEYYLPGTQAFDAYPRPWQEIEQKLKPMVDILAGDDRTAMEGLIGTATAYWGGVLFDLLFGPEHRWETIFRTAFHLEHGARPTPIRAPLRVRVCSEDPLFLNLPWRLTAWEGRLLVNSDWLFVNAAVCDPNDDCTTTAPCGVLLVLPHARPQGLIPAQDHAEAVKEVLNQVWPGGDTQNTLRQARTRRQLEHALMGQRPHLVYVHGYSISSMGRAGLLLDGDKGDDFLAFDALAELFRNMPRLPAAVYFNTAGPVQFSYSPLRNVDPAIPLIIWRRLAHWEHDSNATALSWLKHWLQKGTDPVEALFTIISDNVATSIEAATLTVQANYRTWKTDRFVQSLAKRLTHLRLDRETQKGLVAKWLGELGGSDSFRVMALVPYAAPGNLLKSLSEQLQHHVELALAERVAINWQHLQFPESREALRRDLEHELRLQLDAEEGEPTAHLLRRYAPRVRGGSRAVLWLDFGVYGSEIGQRASLKPDELGSWLRFASGYLVQHCPADLRIVCTLALVVELRNHKRLNQTLQAEHRQLDEPAFWLRILEPLGNVPGHELFDFLKDPTNGCPAPIRAEITERLMVETNGVFEPLLALLTEAETGTWRDLLDRLRRKQGEPTAMDNEPF